MERDSLAQIFHAFVLCEYFDAQIVQNRPGLPILGKYKHVNTIREQGSDNPTSSRSSVFTW